MNIMNAAALTITGTTMKDFYAPDSMGIYSTAYDLKMQLVSSTFKCNTTIDFAYIKSMLNNETYPNYTTTTANFILGAKSVTLTDSSFS